MEFNATITLSIIIAVIALVSPVITTIINNYHQIKIKKLDMYETAKRNALSDFAESCEDFLLDTEYPSIKIWSKYYSSIQQLFIYFDIPDYSMFSQLEETIKKQDVLASNNELTKIVQKLAKQIKKK